MSWLARLIGLGDVVEAEMFVGLDGGSPPLEIPFGDTVYRCNEQLEDGTIVYRWSRLNDG